MSRTPDLQSKTLILRPLGATDRDLSSSLYGDIRVTGGWGMNPLFGKELDRKFDQLTGAWAENGYSQFVIIEKATGQEVGLGGIRPTGTEKEGEIGYVLLPEAWGRGIASEAIRLWTEWGFKNLKLKRIIAQAVENPASIRALEKSGYTAYRKDAEGKRELLSLEKLAEDRGDRLRDAD